ncbi:DUF998 domain-containing protein [Candidatus Bathyarchaeota archaeon]|nr:MAG: DUF998 domain-containing protein [Candidatus Bathyarchaeota archaeon]
MASENAIWLKISGVCGIITPIIAYTFILLAINYYPPFSWTDNALSDLGVVKGITSVLFNSGLIIAGILTLVFATGLFRFLNEKATGKIGGLLFVLAALALTAIGVFPENFGEIHFYVSVAFFVFSPLAMFSFSAAFTQTGNARLGVFTFLVALIAALVWIIHWTIPFGKGVAIPETLSSLSASVWSIVVGFKMLKASSHSTNKP